MSIVYLCSDWHLGHKNIAKFRDVSSAEQNTQRLLQGYLATVTKRDVVWFLGDVAFNYESLQLIRALPGDKRLVLGNHDTERGLSIKDFAEVFTEIHGMVKYKKAWLSHCPLHPSELRGRINIHGHTHGNLVYGALTPDARYINACPEVVGFKPVSYLRLVEHANIRI